MTSSPQLSIQSEDDLFNIPAQASPFETVPTEPVHRIADSPEPNTLASLPPMPQSQHVQGASQGRPLSNSQFITQPTQIIDRSPDRTFSPSHISSPAPPRATVQVTASSPVAAPRSQNARPNGILGSAMSKGPPGAGVMRMSMAPAGTSFRQPVPPQQAQQYSQPPHSNTPVRQLAPSPSPLHSPPQQRQPHNITSPFNENTYDSSDSDHIEAQRNDIKTKTFQRRGIPSTVAGQHYNAPPPTANTFSGLVQQFDYNANGLNQARKRPAPGPAPIGDLVSAYGNVQKRPRQIAPARAMPVPDFSSSPQRSPQRQLMEINDVQDPSLRGKVKRMKGVLPNVTVESCLAALRMKHDNYDDAVDMLLLESEKVEKMQKQQYPHPQMQPNGHSVIMLPSSDDELLMTPAKPPKGVAMSTQQWQPAPQQQTRRAPVKSIAQKWSSTQQPGAPPQGRRLDVFDTPPPEQKRRGLIRGPKRHSPSPRKGVVLDDSDVEIDSGVQSEPDDAKFDARVLTYFNTCTWLELSDISGIPKDQAEHFISFRPFKTLQKVFDVQNPNNKNKTKKGATAYGERIWDKVYEMMRSYEAVDFVVKRCEDMSKPLARSMSTWGVDVYGKGKNDTGLDLVNIDALKSNAQTSSGKDSGIGTPVSDDGRSLFGAKKYFIPQPASLAEGVKMKDYQIVGLNWLYLLFKERLSGILADDMGLGKTLQTIAFIAHLKELGETGPHLIVVPSATLENWLKEFHRFAPALNVQPYYGSIPEREEMRLKYEDERKNINVIVTTYQIAKAKDDIPWLRRYPFTCAIFDEGHQLKNPTSEVATKLSKIKPRFRLLLTGTPLQNNLSELMGLLKFLMPNVFAEREEDMLAIFKQNVTVTTESSTSDSRQMLLSKQRIDRARSMLTPFILRRKKWQVLKDLPKKTRHVISCSMTPEQLGLYQTQLAKAWDIRERKAKGERIPAEENANVLIRLRQAAIHPLLFRCFYTDKTFRRIAKTCPKIDQFRLSNPELIMTELIAYADFETHDLCSKHDLLNPYMLSHEKWELSGKVTELLRLLAKFKEDGHRTLVFSQFVMVLDILQNVLNNNNIPYLRLDGSTRVDERQDMIDVFNKEDSEYEVFMLSTKAGGAGINLTGANRVIVFDSGFNPQDDVQAENRCHRIGQTKDVEVYRLISEGTVEEQIYEMGRVKLQLDREVAGEEGQAVDIAPSMPASGIATPAEPNDDDIVAQKAGRKKKVEDPNGGLSKREAEGAALVEDMLFKKLQDEGNTPAAKPNGTSHALPKPRIKLDTADVKTEGSSLSTLSSPLTELSSMDSDADSEDNLPLRPRSKLSVKEDSPDIGGRGRRKAAQKASANLKDPFADEEPSSQKSTRGNRGAKKEAKKEKEPEVTISRSGRLVRKAKG